MVNSNEIHQNEAFAMGFNDMSQRVLEEKRHGDDSRKQGRSVGTCRVKFPLRWKLPSFFMKCLFRVQIQYNVRFLDQLANYDGTCTPMSASSRCHQGPHLFLSSQQI